MNKKLLIIALSAVMALPTTIAKAGPAPTLVIIDSAVDTSIPELKSKIVYEVCFVSWSTCPNGKTFMEGPGAATVPAKIATGSGLEHGTQMSYAAAMTNPTINIIFIRVIGSTAVGNSQIMKDADLASALSWVQTNKSKFNIQAVSYSRGIRPSLSGANYCPSIPGPQTIIKSLFAEGVPLFNSVGNDKDYSRVNWPACVPEVISIGGAAEGDYIAAYSNYDKLLLDFYAPGSMRVKTVGGSEVNAAGTSIAAVVAASTYLAVKSKTPSLTLTDVLTKFDKSSTQIVGRSGTVGKLIDISALVVNG